MYTYKERERERCVCPLYAGIHAPVSACAHVDMWTCGYVALRVRSGRARWKGAALSTPRAQMSLRATLL